MPLCLGTLTMAPPIISLTELIKMLRAEHDPAGYADVLLRSTIDMSEVLPYCTWNAKHYTRNTIDRTNAHELLAICYEPGQHTSIHDYDSQMAWIKPVQGAVREERFKWSSDQELHCTSTKLLRVGSLSYMAHGDRIHRHSNSVQHRTITLNLYARPLLRWRVYDERTGQASLTGLG